MLKSPLKLWYEFKDKFNSMAGRSSDTEMETISSKGKRDDRTYARKKNAERLKETLRRSAWEYCREQVKYAVRIPSWTAGNDRCESCSKESALCGIFNLKVKRL